MSCVSFMSTVLRYESSESVACEAGKSARLVSPESSVSPVSMVTVSLMIPVSMVSQWVWESSKSGEFGEFSESSESGELSESSESSESG